jgi:dienelactone hydrolase
MECKMMVPERSRRVICVFLILVMLSVAACAAPAETPASIPEGEQESQPEELPIEVPPTTAPAEEGEAAADRPTDTPPESAEPAAPVAPERIEFEAVDGTPLVGLYWAPTDQPAPGVLLLHWNPGTKEDWIEIATALQAGSASELAPGVQLERGYAVFAFDFRGHGESGGPQNREANVGDALTALALFRTLPGVDPASIAMVGASIGSDAAVDACGEGCVTAVSLSPGGFLGVAYPEAVSALDVPILCVASEGDGPSPGACRDGEAAAQAEYQVQIYSGSAHGMAMFDITDQTPLLVDLLFEWLKVHLP